MLTWRNNISITKKHLPIIQMLQGLFGHGICFAVGAIFGISDCSNREDVPGEVRKAVILIRGILMFMVVAGVTTAAAVITTMQDKAQEDKMDSITTLENDFNASVSTTLETTEATETISTAISSTTTIETTVTTTMKSDCEFHENFFLK